VSGMHLPRQVEIMTFLSRCFLWLAIFLSPVISQAAGIAQARMYCFSPRFQQSDDQIGFFTLALTTLSFGINGERLWRLLWNGSFAFHISDFN
jgi:hypothetical protein